MRLEDSLEHRFEELFRIKIIAANDTCGAVLALDHWKSGKVMRLFSARLEDLPAGQSSMESADSALWLMGQAGSETYGRSITAKARQTLILTNRTGYVQIGLMYFGHVDSAGPKGTLVKVDLAEDSDVHNLIVKESQKYKKELTGPAAGLSPLNFVAGDDSGAAASCSNRLTVRPPEENP